MTLSVVLAAAVGEASTPNPMSLDLWTLLFQSLNILIVLAVLYFLLFRPLGTMMAKRENHVADSLSQAAQTRQEAEKLFAEYQEKMRLVQAETEKTMAEAATMAQQYGAQRKVEADKQYEEMLQKARKEIAAERTQAMAAMRDEVASLAMMAASQVLGRAISADDHRHLIEDFVQKVGDSSDVQS